MAAEGQSPMIGAEELAAHLDAAQSNLFRDSSGLFCGYDDAVGRVWQAEGYMDEIGVVDPRLEAGCLAIRAKLSLPRN